jgi:Methyltransferase domain
MLPDDLVKYHRLNVEDPVFATLLKDPMTIGIPPEELQGKQPEQITELVFGEYFALVAAHMAKLASILVSNGQWGYGGSDWFDHRQHIWDPKDKFNDFWAMSADNSIEVMPMGAKVLELCAGDAFYDYNFYRHRASKIVCVDINKNPYYLYKRLYQAPNIEYHLTDVLAYDAGENQFDNVIIRGAIEHFSEANQQLLFRK